MRQLSWAVGYYEHPEDVDFEGHLLDFAPQAVGETRVGGRTYKIYCKRLPDLYDWELYQILDLNKANAIYELGEVPQRWMNLQAREKVVITDEAMTIRDCMPLALDQAENRILSPMERLARGLCG